MPIYLSRIYVPWLSSVTVSSRATDCQKVEVNLQKKCNIVLQLKCFFWLNVCLCFVFIMSKNLKHIIGFQITVWFLSIVVIS